MHGGVRAGGPLGVGCQGGPLLLPGHQGCGGRLCGCSGTAAAGVCLGGGRVRAFASSVAPLRSTRDCPQVLTSLYSSLHATTLCTWFIFWYKHYVWVLETHLACARIFGRGVESLPDIGRGCYCGRSEMCCSRGRKAAWGMRCAFLPKAPCCCCADAW